MFPEKYNTDLSEVLFAFRMARRNKPALPAERQKGRRHNTVRDLLNPLFASIPDEDPKLQLALDEFQNDAYSNILERKRARGSKLESTFRQQRGRFINETTHTLSLLPPGKAAPRLLSKRDVACVPADKNTKLPTKDL